jgi:glyoxylase-like metal-dependent hydrolase (beta-lactamase superfamily II)
MMRVEPSAGPRVLRVLAPNPGPFTLEGTNTWVVGSDASLVIDPGPEDQNHLDAVLQAAGRVAAVLLTHRHLDHASGAGALARVTGAPVYAASPGEDAQAATDGDRIERAGVRLEVVAAPGHSPDHLVFFEPATRALFTGDAILGRGTSVIDPPEGDLTDYLRSLERMRGLTPRVIFPGHGPVVERAMEKIEEYVDHRRQREEEVLRGLLRNPRTPQDLVPEIYAGYAKELYPAASRSVLAHLLKLEREGRVVRSGQGDQFALSEPSGSTT